MLTSKREKLSVVIKTCIYFEVRNFKITGFTKKVHQTGSFEMS